jgi:hypothetical protein
VNFSEVVLSVSVSTIEALAMSNLPPAKQRQAVIANNRRAEILRIFNVPLVWQHCIWIQAWKIDHRGVSKSCGAEKGDDEIGVFARPVD